MRVLYDLADEKQINDFRFIFPFIPFGVMIEGSAVTEALGRRLYHPEGANLRTNIHHG
mgnify:CR=1 FL=1